MTTTSHQNTDAATVDLTPELFTLSSSPAFDSPGHRVVQQPRIWGGVPRRNPNFVGRTELLERLSVDLNQPNPAAVLSEALHGMGGVGKTQIVVEYLHRYSSDYELVWWIPAEHLTQVMTSFIELAKKLQISVSESTDVTIAAVLEALRIGSPFQRWILVFDNADDPTVIQPFFPAGTGHIIVTTRNPQWSAFARSVEVDLFTRSESIELLRGRAGAIADIEAENLAEALGDLPLALEQAASWRAQTGMEVAEYLRLLNQNYAELLATVQSTESNLPVAAAWNASIDRLNVNNPAAVELLQLCAFFSFEPISQRIFRNKTLETPRLEKFTEVMADPIKLSLAVRELVRYGLIKIDHHANTLQLHRVVRSVIRSKLSIEDQQHMRHAVHMLLVQHSPRDPRDARHWQDYSEILSHVRGSNAIESQDKRVWVLLIELSKYLNNIGDWNGALTFTRQVIEKRKAAHDSDEIATLELTQLYAHANWRLGNRSEARTLNKQIYSRLVELVGEQDERAMATLNSIASDHRALGRFTEELELRKELYHRACSVLTVDHFLTLTYAHNVGSSYRLTGEFTKALTADEETLRRHIATHGPRHVHTLATHSAVYMDIRETGRYLEAALGQEKILTELIKVAGTDHYTVIGATRNLSVSLRKAGHYHRARTLSEKVLALYRKKWGDQHIDSATAQMNLATDFRHEGDLERSLHLAEASYQVLCDVLFEHHPFALIAALNLAVTLRLRGNINEAISIDQQSYEILTETLGADHPITLVAATNLASDFAALNNFAQAKLIDQDTLSRSTVVLGEKHPATLAVSLNYALDLFNLAETDEATRLHIKTVQGFYEVLGEDHPETHAAIKRVRVNCDTDTMQF